GLYVAYQRRNSLSPNTPKRAILNLRIAGVIVYFFAAIDYLCNYGIEFYPPGFLFVGISLGMLAVAIIRYNIMDPMAVAGSIAHEIRNTLGTILMQAEFSGVYWDDLYQGYQLAVKHGLYPANISPDVLECLSEVAGDISQDVAKSNLLIGTMLASVSMDQLDKSEFKNHSISACVTDVLRRYPFSKQERADTTISKQEDFDFYGSDTLLTFALFNLIKNALYAISKAGHGSITLSFERGATYNRLHVTDTSTGIAPEAIPRIFDMFFTTKKSAGNGFGLAFCQRVMKSFDGRISCDSVLGEYTTFTLEFPVIVPPVS
ncbi:MAG: HAMP domain-containing sensor histidine kinase, partial [Pseudomonadota bacterium]